MYRYITFTLTPFIIKRMHPSTEYFLHVHNPQHFTIKVRWIKHEIVTSLSTRDVQHSIDTQSSTHVTHVPLSRVQMTASLLLVLTKIFQRRYTETKNVLATVPVNLRLPTHCQYFTNCQFHSNAFFYLPRGFGSCATSFIYLITAAATY